jgi:probable F420-dependent oxidoreductase
MKFWMAMAFLDTTDVLPLARAADAAGIDGITVSDHLFEPQERRSPYPYSADGAPPFAPDTAWPDPWVLIGAMAAVTERIRFTNNIYIAPLRELFTVAKLVSTAAVISGNRVAMGAGPGWCEEEFDQVGQAFKGRGARLEEMIDVLHQLWAGGWVEHHGEHYDFDALRIDPVPTERVPVYIGGHSDIALSRAARVGDGWIGNAYAPDEAEHYLGILRGHLKAADRLDDPDFEVILGLMAMPSHELHEKAAAMGITGLLCAPYVFAPSPDERTNAIEAFGAEFCQ